MAVPRSRDARLFYRCAYQRYEEAVILFDAGRTTGAVYLAGYAVECMLKALWIVASPAADREDVVKSFRGRRAHEFEWLRENYFSAGGTRFPREIARAFTLVNIWSTDLRYSPRSVLPPEAEGFRRSVEAIIRWADGRF